MRVTNTLAISNQEEEKRAASKVYGEPVYLKMDWPWVKRADFKGVWVTRLGAIGSLLENIQNIIAPREK